MKRFNLTGVCVPDKHYMVDLSEKIDIIIRDYIEQGAYFTINRARQYGKTTILSALARRLGKHFLVIRISFEAADDYFASQLIFANGIVMDIAEAMEREGVGGSILNQWREKIEGDYPLRALGRKISDLCKNIGKDVVLMIDEVDKCSDNQIFLNFLGLLRSKYLDMQEGWDISFRSVILAGVYNIKNLKLKLRSETERKYNSPWNIAVDFDVDMSFSSDEIEKMLEQYSVDTGISMDVQAVSEKIRFYTSGYPFLVSWLCKWIDERGGRQWNVRNVENAEKELLNNDNTLFDDMIKNLENNKELKQIVTNILLEGKKLLCVKSDPAINMGMMFGILSDKENMVCISNIIFETYLYNHVIAGKMREQYNYVEPETRDNTRMDVVISYGGREYIVELKIYRGQKYRRKGLEQLEKYLDSRNSQKGYLVSFNFNKEKTYVQNTIILENSQKEVYEIVV